MSKFAEVNEKIAEALVGGCKKIEEGVVTGFNQISDKIIGAVFSRDGESADAAICR